MDEENFCLEIKILNINTIFSDYDNANRLVSKCFASASPLRSAATVMQSISYYDNDQPEHITAYDTNGTTVLKHSQSGYDYQNRLSWLVADIDSNNSAVTNYYYNDLLDPNNPAYIHPDFVGHSEYDIQIVDAENKTTFRQLDYNGKLMEILYPSGLARRWQYYYDGKLKAEAVFDSQNNVDWINYNRQNFGRLTEKLYPNNSKIE